MVRLQLRQHGGPGVHGDDHLLGGQDAARRHHPRRPAAVEAHHRRPLVDAHAVGERHAPQAPREQGRLHGGPGRLVDAGDVTVCARALLHRLRLPQLEGVQLVARQRVHQRVPGAGLRLAGCGPEPAVAAVVRVDPVLGAEAADLATASADARASRAASSDGQNLASEPNLAHQLSTKPPLRPLAPLPHSSFSTMAMSREGSRSFRRSAVHSPQKPPPTMQMSRALALERRPSAEPGFRQQWLSIRLFGRKSSRNCPSTAPATWLSAPAHRSVRSIAELEHRALGAFPVSTPGRPGAASRCCG